VKLWDVNLWVYAFRRDSPLHARARGVLIDSLDRGESFLFCPSVAASFIRLVTNPRIFEEPSPPEEAWLFVDHLESHPAASFAEVDAMTFGIFKHLCLASRASGNAVPDALLAAIALRHDAGFVTADAGMRRFAGVDVELLE
jgi:toxin-antitoxin system PIN domain toxin